jgi:hypothetical protein
MKWWKTKLGVADTGQHMARVLERPDARGIFISNSGFTDAVVLQCTNVLPKLMCVLCELEEIVLLLERGEDLKKFLSEKVRAITLDRNPLHRPLKK